MVNINSHISEIYTLVSEIQENVDLVLGIKNMFELEGMLIHENVISAFWIGQYQYFQKKE